MTHEQFQNLLPDLAKGYQPAPEVVSHIGNVVLLMTVGPSGVGKTSLMKELGLPYVASDTTRDRRPEEKDGIDYHFRSDYGQIIQDIKDGRFVQIAVGPAGDLYATRDESYPETSAATMAVVADVVPIFRDLKFEKTITAFITPPSYQEWQRRLSAHPVTEQQKAKRLAEACRSFEFALNDNQTHIILNDDLGMAAKQLAGLLKGKVDTDRERRGWEAVQAILERLGTSVIN